MKPTGGMKAPVSHSLFVAAMLVAAAAICLAVPLSTPATAGKRPLRIVLDPGHGGENMGAVGPYGVHEKHITMILANKVADLFKDNPDVVIFFTRRDDSFVSLRDRAAMANAVGADMLLSIHCNASTNRGANGIETFFVGPGSDESTRELAGRENGEEALPDAADRDRSLNLLLADMAFNGTVNESALLAEEIQKSLMASLPGARDRKVRQAPFTVLQEARVPAIVIETGFITHETEGRQLLMSGHQDTIARAIYEGVLNFIASLDEMPAFARQYELE